jgi:nucleoside-diphosphate-sugar epimerase
VCDDVAQAGGCVIRLAGLYSLERGAHSFWLARGSVDSPPGGLINLLSYDDAAGAVVATLQQGNTALTLLASDDASPPLTRREICAAALRHPMYRSAQMPVFAEQAEGVASDLGKVYDSGATRRIIGWAPKHK